MEVLNLDLGIKEYQLTEKGVLRFNPSDPNLYDRFLNAESAIRDVERESAEKAKQAESSAEGMGEAAIRIMADADRKMKDILNGVYGHGNDFHAILEDVNLLAVGSNGNRIISNLMDVLTPIMESGAKSFAAGEIVVAKQNREQRRVQQ